MKFRAERVEFADAASWALHTVGARATRPALSGVRLEVRGDRLEFSSTDLDMSSVLSLAVHAERDGVALVPGRLLAELVRSLPNAAVEAEANGDELFLSCGRAQFHIRLMPMDDFPVLPEPSADAPAAVMKAEEFARTVVQVARAASLDGARPALTGVQLEATAGALTAAATDSYRLAVCTVPWDQGTDTTVLVPRKALEAARRSADQLGSEVRLILEQDQVTFEFGDRRLTTQLIGHKFPDFRQLIPSAYERRLTVDRAEFSDVVKRISVIGDSNTTATPVTLHMTSDTVRVTAGSGEIGRAEEALPATLEGEDLTIAFNPRYLADGLEAAGTERVVLEFRDELKPAVLRPATSEGEEQTADFLYLLMPVRI